MSGMQSTGPEATWLFPSLQGSSATEEGERTAQTASGETSPTTIYKEVCCSLFIYCVTSKKLVPGPRSTNSPLTRGANVIYV